MGCVAVLGGTVSDGRIASLQVKMAHLPARTIDRATAVAWMRDGHSFLPKNGRALQLVEVGEEGFIRDDHDAIAEDSLPDLTTDR
jgi:hypothetical protein